MSRTAEPMPTHEAPVTGDAPPLAPAIFRLRKHADFQRVYSGSRKHHSKQMSYFFHPSPGATQARVGLTVGKVMGKAVDRNRIKRRVREAVRRHVWLLQTPVDVVLHPRRGVKEVDFGTLERDVAAVFRAIERMVAVPSSHPDGGRS